MQVKIFTIPITDDGRFTDELNKFLRSHKILEVQQQLSTHDNGAFWCFCIRYLPHTLTHIEAGRSGKIDYRETLNEAAFKKFSRFREIRKQLAAEDGVPAYAVFTDEELANLSQLAALDLKGLKSIKGIGDKKADRYGAKMLNIYHQTLLSASPDDDSVQP
ncbi:MAG: HRDC domain-containing protein [Sphingobacteriales bacterium]|nr:HRDC domain-containing protein [Sphingobacteriales bacterium]